MPYANVQITKSGVTKEHKAQLVSDITSSLQKVLGKKPEHIHVVIELVEEENWGYAGMLTTEFRQAENSS